MSMSNIASGFFAMVLIPVLLAALGGDTPPAPDARAGPGPRGAYLASR
jgi:hypothetical protein